MSERAISEEVYPPPTPPTTTISTHPPKPPINLAGCRLFQSRKTPNGVVRARVLRTSASFSDKPLLLIFVLHGGAAKVFAARESLSTPILQKKKRGGGLLDSQVSEVVGDLTEQQQKFSYDAFKQDTLPTGICWSESEWILRTPLSPGHRAWGERW